MMNTCTVDMHFNLYYGEKVRLDRVLTSYTIKGVVSNFYDAPADMLDEYTGMQTPWCCDNMPAVADHYEMIDEDHNTEPKSISMHRLHYAKNESWFVEIGHRSWRKYISNLRAKNSKRKSSHKHLDHRKARHSKLELFTQTK